MTTKRNLSGRSQQHRVFKRVSFQTRKASLGVSRLLVYTAAIPEETLSKKDIRATIKSLERDTQSLSTSVDFLSNKVTFLLDTVVGLISIEQNAIIKIFSVAAVAFMPPTLVASIYGMNFHFMPELDEVWGYPMAIALMIASAVIPLLIFRKRAGCKTTIFSLYASYTHVIPFVITSELRP